MKTYQCASRVGWPECAARSRRRRRTAVLAENKGDCTSSRARSRRVASCMIKWSTAVGCWCSRRCCARTFSRRVGRFAHVQASDSQASVGRRGHRGRFHGGDVAVASEREACAVAKRDKLLKGGAKSAELWNALVVELPTWKDVEPPEWLGDVVVVAVCEECLN
jgi:hypothetical protein